MYQKYWIFYFQAQPRNQRNVFSGWNLLESEMQHNKHVCLFTCKFDVYHHHLSIFVIRSIFSFSCLASQILRYKIELLDK